MFFLCAFCFGFCVIVFLGVMYCVRFGFHLSFLGNCVNFNLLFRPGCSLVCFCRCFLFVCAFWVGVLCVACHLCFSFSLVNDVLRQRFDVRSRQRREFSVSAVFRVEEFVSYHGFLWRCWLFDYFLFGLSFCVRECFFSVRFVLVSVLLFF